METVLITLICSAIVSSLLLFAEHTNNTARQNVSVGENYWLLSLSNNLPIIIDNNNNSKDKIIRDFYFSLLMRGDLPNFITKNRFTYAVYRKRAIRDFLKKNGISKREFNKYKQLLLIKNKNEKIKH